MSPRWGFGFWCFMFSTHMPPRWGLDDAHTKNITNLRTRVITIGRNEHMPTPKTKPYTKALKETMRRKSEILSKAQALWEIGMTETAQPLWLSAATYEEHIAPMLDALGRELEGAIHRISAASCYEMAEDPT